MQTDFKELGEKTIQSQYAASPHITGLVRDYALKIDPTGEILSFLENVFDPRTAKGVGLDIWGRIVGATRYMEVENEDFFGFLGSQLHPWNQSPFWSKAGASNVRYVDDEAYRQLIFLKAAGNIGNATLPSIKATLTECFGHEVLALDSLVSLGDMKIRVVFTKYLTPYQRAILRNYGLLNLGAGVGFEYYVTDTEKVFGFYGSQYQPWDQGGFQPYGIVQTEDWF